MLALPFFTFPAQAQNVGIGTATPGAPLHIKATSSEILRVEAPNPYISFFNGAAYSGYLWYNSNKMELGTPTGSGEPVVIAPSRIATAYFTSAGRMGLGLAAPTERLDVNGNINLNGVIKLNGSSGTTGQVLTSNGAADPTWKAASYGNNTRCAVDFSQTGTCCALSISSTKYNLNPSDITITANTISIVRSGLYRFEGDYQGLIQGSGFTALPEGSFTLSFVEGTELSYNLESFAPFRLRTSVSNNYWLTGRFSVDVHIIAPTNVQLLRSFLTTGGTVTSSSGTGTLLVHLISD